MHTNIFAYRLSLLLLLLHGYNVLLLHTSNVFWEKQARVFVIIILYIHTELMRELD
jgi:hypothetical protein